MHRPFAGVVAPRLLAVSERGVRCAELSFAIDFIVYVPFLKFAHNLVRQSTAPPRFRSVRRRGSETWHTHTERICSAVRVPRRSHDDIPVGFCQLLQLYLQNEQYEPSIRLAMGTDSPYADLIDAVTRPPPLYKLADGQTGVRHKDRPVEVLLYLDLKDVYFGCIKKHTFCRHEFIDDSRTATKLCEHVFTIPIQPGVPAGRRITFTGAGDRSVMRLPADIVFVMEDRKDAVYRRNGNDLHWDYEVDLLRSLRGFVIEVVTVDCRRFLVSVLNVVR